MNNEKEFPPEIPIKRTLSIPLSKGKDDLLVYKFAWFINYSIKYQRNISTFVREAISEKIEREKEELPQKFPSWLNK